MNQQFPLYNTQKQPQIIVFPPSSHAIPQQSFSQNFLPQPLIQGPPHFIVSNPNYGQIPQIIHPSKFYKNSYNIANSGDLRRFNTLNYIQMSKPALQTNLRFIPNGNQPQFIPKCGYFPSLNNIVSTQTLNFSRISSQRDIPPFPFSSNLSLQNNVHELKSAELPQRKSCATLSSKKNYEVYSNEGSQPNLVDESNSSLHVKKNSEQNGEEERQKGLTKEQKLEEAILRYFEEYQIEMPLQNQEETNEGEKSTDLEDIEVKHPIQKNHQNNGSLDKTAQNEEPLEKNHQMNGSLNKIVQKEEAIKKNNQNNDSLNKIVQKEEPFGSLDKIVQKEEPTPFVQKPQPPIQNIVQKEQPPIQNIVQKEQPPIQKIVQKEHSPIQNIAQKEQSPIQKIPQKGQPSILNTFQNKLQKIPENEELHIKQDLPIENVQKGEEISSPNKEKSHIGSIHYMMSFHLDQIGKEQNTAKAIPEIKRGSISPESPRKKSRFIKTLEDYLEMPELPYFKEFTAAYESAMKSGKNFVDKDFYPDRWSIFERKNSVREGKWSDFIWCRPKEFLKGDYFIFNKDNSEDVPLLKSLRESQFSNIQTNQAIDVDDIVQGSLGDCYFLSCLSSLAENPIRIRNLFISKRVNEKCGVYCVKICHEGLWRAVFVDDYFPCYSKTQGPCFSKSKKGENELWVLILEKAWAKLYSNYERIEAGLTREVLRDLTGAPTKVVWTDEPNLWEEILKGEEKDYIMTAGAIDAAAMAKVKINEGMVSGHAYSLISAHVVRKTQVLKLRNPWGKGEWKGPWCDEDPIWNSVTVKEKEEVGFNVKDDGTFFMGLDYFMKIYSDVQICMVEDCYDYVSIPLKTQKKKGVYLEVEVMTDGEYFFTILQPTSRKMNNPNYTESQVHIVLAQRENEDLVFVNAKQGTHREVFIQNPLKKGKYMIYCKADWENANEGSFVLSSYGEDAVTFKILQKQPNFFERVYMNKAMNSEKKKTYEPLHAEKAVEFFPGEGYGYFFVDNREKKSLTSGIRMMKYGGLTLKKKYGKMEKGKNFELTTKGNSKRILIFRVEKVGYSVDYDEEIQF